MSCSRTQCSYTGEVQTCNPWISSQALYHCATGIPERIIGKSMLGKKMKKKSAEDKNACIIYLPIMQRIKLPITATVSKHSYDSVLNCIQQSNFCHLLILA